MKVVCKIDGAICPKNLNICCCTCKHKDDCYEACLTAICGKSFMDCDNSEAVIADGC